MEMQPAMTSTGSFDHGAENWDEFKSWLKEQHLKGNNLLGLGIDDYGFIAFNDKHIVKKVPGDASPILDQYGVVQILRDPDDDPDCFIYLKDECNSSLIQMQLAWSRHIFLPVEERDYWVCMECERLIPDDEINHFRSVAKNRNTVPQVCNKCAKK